MFYIKMFFFIRYFIFLTDIWKNTVLVLNELFGNNTVNLKGILGGGGGNRRFVVVLFQLSVVFILSIRWLFMAREK